MRPRDEVGRPPLFASAPEPRSGSSRGVLRWALLLGLGLSPSSAFGSFGEAGDGSARERPDEGTPTRSSTVAAGRSEPLAGQSPPKRSKEDDARLLGSPQDLGAPEWLELSLTHRTRYERLLPQFREGQARKAEGLSLRTLFLAGVTWGAFSARIELMDARFYRLGSETPVNTTLSNAFELLQVQAQLLFEDVIIEADALEARLGRLTMDVGSRRLVARNRFRNTVNGFSGVDLRWRGPSKETVRLFLTVPVARRPDQQADLRANAVRLDRERVGTFFGGFFFESQPVFLDLRIESYLMGLYETDEDELPTRNRRLVTPGARVVRKPTPGGFDVEVEGILQYGTSRRSTQSEDVDDENHFAFFFRAAAGYTLDAFLHPRLLVVFDQASGDDEGRGRRRFDTLFGARRFDFGPTGIYGLLARANLRSVGARIDVKTKRRFDGLFFYRTAWLFSATDALTTAGYQDPTGESGRFIGHQLEARVRFRPLPGLTLEVGGAHAFFGSFPSSARSDGVAAEDPTYFYGQTIVSL